MSELKFESVGKPIKFIKYKKCNVDDVLVDAGIYLGIIKSKYGDNHKFKELKDEQIVVLNSSGHLNHLVKTYLTEGDTCKVIYKGMETMKKGAMVGKDAHTFELFKANAFTATKVNEAKVATKTLSLDDLE